MSEQHGATAMTDIHTYSCLKVKKKTFFTQLSSVLFDVKVLALCYILRHRLTIYQTLRSCVYLLATELQQIQHRLNAKNTTTTWKC